MSGEAEKKWKAEGEADRKRVEQEAPAHTVSWATPDGSAVPPQPEDNDSPPPPSDDSEVL